jgi:acetyltransferase-like isoleucine patch superfamily enzyme
MFNFIHKNTFINSSPIYRWLIWYKHYLKIKKKFPRFQLGYQAFFIDSIAGKHCLIAEGVCVSDSILGDFSYISNQSIIGNCTVGKFTCIGPNVKIGLGKHPTSKFISSHPAFFSLRKQIGITFIEKQLFNEYETTAIGNDVWIGAGAIIMDGISIGNGAIIAAGAVVSKNVEPYSIVGGIPAKEIKKRFNDDDIRFLEELNWWHKEENWIRGNAQYFFDIDVLKKKLNALL